MNEQTGLLLKASAKADLEKGAAPSLERRRLHAYIVMLVVDILLIQASFAIAALAYESQWFEPRAMLAAHTLLPPFVIIALYSQVYSTHTLSSWFFGARKAVSALIISAALVNFIAFYMKANAEFSRVSVTAGFVLAALFLIAFRRLVPVLVRRFLKGRTRNELVIDDDGPSFVIPGAVSISARDFGIDPASGDPFMFDRLGRLLRNQDKVVVTCPPERRRNWSLLLKSAGVFGEVVSTTAHELGAVGVHHYGRIGQTTLVVSNGPLGFRARVAKRLFDTSLALAALAVLFPLLLAIALIIKLEDGGPVFFIQRRMGRGNRFFDMIKFRSMSVAAQDDNGALSTHKGDVRLTRIGGFIRSNSLDELPQLVNVLKGDMSIVGPRPHALGSLASNQLFWIANPDYLLRHSLKPGLTGLAQVRGFRGATEYTSDLTDRLHADLEYISAWSLLRDVQIMIQTAAVLRHEKAF